MRGRSFFKSKILSRMWRKTIMKNKSSFYYYFVHIFCASVVLILSIVLLTINFKNRINDYVFLIDVILLALANIAIIILNHNHKNKMVFIYTIVFTIIFNLVPFVVFIFGIFDLYYLWSIIVSIVVSVIYVLLITLLYYQQSKLLNNEETIAKNSKKRN